MTTTETLKAFTRKQSTAVLVQSMTDLDAQIDEATSGEDLAALHLAQAVIFDEIESRTPGLTDLLDQWIEADDERTYAQMIRAALEEVAR